MGVLISPSVSFYFKLSCRPDAYCVAENARSMVRSFDFPVLSHHPTDLVVQFLAGTPSKLVMSEVGVGANSLFSNK